MIDLDELRKKAEAANACGGGPITVDELKFIQAVTPNVVIELIDRVDKVESEGDACLDHAAAQEDAYRRVSDENSRLRALLARSGEALKPFHTVDGAEPLDWTTDDGWSALAPQNERISAWFGPHDFYTVRTVAAEIEKEIGNG